MTQFSECSHSQLFIIWLFGLISGFTLMITSTSLNYWLAKENINVQTVGLFALILMPYSINFLCAPIFDTVRLGYLSDRLGYRLSWLCLIQILLACFIFILSYLNPHNSLLLFATTAVIVSFCSSAQDDILGALKTEILPIKSQGATSGIYVLGYRMGMLLSSSGAIYLSAYIEWNKIYKIFSIIVLVFPIVLMLNIKHFKNELTSTLYQNNCIKGLILIDPTQKSISVIKITNLFNFIENILKPVGSPTVVLLIIAFLVLYRLPDNFISMMINPFLLHLGYNALEIASAGKLFGVIGAIIGGFIASSIMKKKNILDSLLIFGIIHAVAHTLFILQEICGKNVSLLFISVAFESITGGMAMAAYIAFIASICQGKFRATQYSFFSAMMGVSRSIFPALSGYIVIRFGWQNFFIFVTIFTIPSLLVLLKISSKLKQI